MKKGDLKAADRCDCVEIKKDARIPIVSQCVAMRCSVMHFVVACCRVLQCGATYIYPGAFERETE